MTGLRWPVRLVLLALALVAVLALGARGVVTPPDLVVLVVVGVALAAGSGAGALTGLVDGWLAGSAHRRAGHPWWWSLPVVVGACLVTRAAPVLVDLGSARPVAWGALAWQVIATATIGLVLVTLVERVEATLVQRRWA